MTPSHAPRARSAAAEAAGQPFDVDAALQVVRRRVPFTPRVGIVLGSGLGVIAEGTAWKAEIPYDHVPGLPSSTVAGHAGRFLLGTWAGRPVAIAQGRSHLYEGHPAETVTRMVQLLAALGTRALILTNASGGIAPRMTPGTLVVIEDHVNLQWRSPLREAEGDDEEREGAVEETSGRGLTRRPVYDPDLIARALRAGAMAGVPLQRGVLGVMLGPSYETPAEIRMLERMGADIVCMSTAAEAAMASTLGIPCAAISCVTNWAAGRSPRRLSHQDVTASVAGAAGPFKAMLERLVVGLV